MFSPAVICQVIAGKMGIAELVSIEVFVQITKEDFFIHIGSGSLEDDHVFQMILF